MCTITVHRASDELLVTMNRDELRARGPERAPEVFEQGGVRWTGPIDSPSGGTWMGVNDRGLVACLLNAYEAGDAPVATGAIRSRGEIVPAVLGRGTYDEAAQWLDRAMDPAAYPPFHLLVVSGGGGMMHTWLGEGSWNRAPVDGDWWMWTTSLWQSGEVRAFRRRCYEDWRAQGCPRHGLLPSMHRMRIEGFEECSPLMDREFTATRSITQAWLGDRIELRYWPRPDNAALPDAPAKVVRLNAAK
jgi:hypothetical protein